jgi:hypothetical protein
MLAGMNHFFDIDYTTQLSMHLIPIAISLIITSLILFATLKDQDNRPRTAIAGGFVWAVLTAGFDYVFLLDGFKFLSKYLPIEGLEGYLKSLVEMFDSISVDFFYSESLTITIIRYLIIFLAPFIISLFIPRKEMLPAKRESEE